MGSVDETRQFEPPVTDPGTARRACEELGGELAGAGWNLVVYSGRPSFAEADVVRGYLRSGMAPPRSIEVRAPLGKTGFDEFSANGEAFDIHPDPSRDWEVSFYRSLAGVDGPVGGGRSTLITGLIALTLRIPLVTVAGFGGNAQKVWERLANERNDATGDDVAAMAAAWRRTSPPDGWCAAWWRSGTPVRSGAAASSANISAQRLRASNSVNQHRVATSEKPARVKPPPHISALDILSVIPAKFSKSLRRSRAATALAAFEF